MAQPSFNQYTSVTHLSVSSTFTRTVLLTWELQLCILRGPVTDSLTPNEATRELRG